MMGASIQSVYGYERWGHLSRAGRGQCRDYNAGTVQGREGGKAGEGVGLHGADRVAVHAPGMSGEPLLRRDKESVRRGN